MRRGSGRADVRRAAIAAVALAAACSGPGKREPATTAPPTATPAATPATIDAGPRPGGRGEACTEGSCAEGLLCFTRAPGGYCTSFCGGTGGPCDDGACVETAVGGEVCAPRCASDADCRADEGYVCDPDWHGCVLPGLAAPKLASCDSGAPLANRAFTDATQVSTSAGPGVYHHEPAAALDAKGDLVMLYIAGAALGAPNSLGESRILADGTVDPDRTVTSGRENHFDPWMAADASGRLHAVWLAFDGGRAPEKDMAIEYATSSDGGVTWSTPVAVQAAADCPDGTPGCVDKPMIAIGRDASRPKDKKAEAIYVFYASEVAGGLRMVASRDGGATWTPDSVAVLPSSYGDVTVDAAGAIHVVSANATPAAPWGAPDQYVEYTVSRDGGATFAPPVQVSDEGEAIPFYFVNPTLGVAPKGKRVYVAYASANAGAGPDAWHIVLASSKDGATWTRRDLVAPGDCGTAIVPNLAVSAKGSVYVTWSGNADGGRLAVVRCAADAATCDPAEKVSAQPFASFSLSRHSTKWTGEYGALVVDEKRGRLHAVWTQTVDEGGTPTARIFHASAALE